MTAHKHAELMAQYAQDARETNEPWERWQVNEGDGWIDCCHHPCWWESFDYRRKPKTSRERFEEWCSKNFEDPPNKLFYGTVLWGAWQEAERQAKELSDD